MQKGNRRLFWTTVLLVGFGVGFVAGSFLGYRQGWTYCQTAVSAGDALSYVTALRALHKGDPESAIRFLESSLDISVHMHGVFKRSRWRPFAVFDTLDEVSRRSMQQVAVYRHVHPHTSTVVPAGVVPEILKDYRNSER